MSFDKLQFLGWSNHFEQQLTKHEKLENSKNAIIFRIIAIHRGRIVGLGHNEETSLIAPEELEPVSQFLAVGDWVIAQPAYEHHRIIRILNPINRAERLSRNVVQKIAANLNHLWIVTSANDEFNLRRLHRYVSMAHKFNIEPVLILNKVDLCKDLDVYLDQIADLNVLLVHPISSLNAETYEQLERYFVKGNTIAIVGSSGVGKSTILNKVSTQNRPTSHIREFDSKGQHTTTHRELFFCKNGVAIIDTPGMRELQLVESDENQAVQTTFDDIAEFITQCKFNNCSHSAEPGCAINKALDEGYLEPEYYDNYLKLVSESEAQSQKEASNQANKQFFKAHFKKQKSTKKKR